MADTGTRNRKSKALDELPKTFNSLEEAAEFWDTHDSADYDEYFTDAECEFDIKETMSRRPFSRA